MSIRPIPGTVDRATVTMPRAVLGLGLAVIVVGVITAAPHAHSVLDHAGGAMLVFLITMAAGSLLQVRLPSGELISPVAQAIAIGMAFGSQMAGVGSLSYRSEGVIVASAAGLIVGTLLLTAWTRRSQPSALVAARLVSVAVAAVLYRTVPIFHGSTALERYPEWSSSRWRMTLVMFAIGLVAAAVELVLATAVTTRERSFKQALIEGGVAAGPVSLAVVSTGIAIALGLAPLGLLSIVLMVCPLVLLRFTILQEASVRLTRRQTIAALSRLTEVAGYTPPGHSHRVAMLSVRVGRSLRLPERDLVVLEDAALLHDIGQVYLSEPIPGGATVEAAPRDQDSIASEGADIVRRTKALDDVAAVMEAQATQFRLVREHGDQVPLASRIIKVCNAYDDLTRGDSARRSEAIERLYLGLGYEYDPEVLEALVGVVEGISGRPD
ncbi:HD-GYP domain-containing protein [Leekyejoonella antrihumi]|uniref:HD-GYP domain-containing protein n=1 Tax=Leekyejoonella antrihumi TaxID=1660198 RepID=UPI0016465C52|nr:HD domain-containing phosphohydrolase [Leekyejoonella antrihumi]